jgi:hypothetical protein
MAFVLGFWNVYDALAITQYGDEVRRSHSIPVQMRVGLSPREVHEWQNRRSCGHSHSRHFTTSLQCGRSSSKSPIELVSVHLQRCLPIKG